jgi:hypothetical protein
LVKRLKAEKNTRQRHTDRKSTLARARGQVLAAYASYRALDLAVVKLQEANMINADSQAAALGQLRDQVKELKTQARWTKWLAIGTIVLALATLISILALALAHV